MNLNDNIIKGKIGEDIAKKYLQSIGYKIIDCNWHYSKNAEIDIIALDKNVLVFVEVKTRTSDSFGHPFEAISKTKLSKIHSAVSAYISSTDISFSSYRIDGIAILGIKNPQIEHLKNLGQY